MRRFLPLAILTVGALAAPVLAQQVVHFADGRAMQVVAAEYEDDVARLTLEGGTTMVIPARLIVTQHALATVDETPLPTRVVYDPDEAWRLVAGEYSELIARAAARHRLDPALLTALAAAESSFNPLAVSPKGACGLLQLMPATAARFGVDDVFDVQQNVEGGAAYLSWLLDRFDGQTELAVAGYNAGEAAVDRYSGIPPYRETRRYVDRVMAGAGQLARLAP